MGRKKLPLLEKIGITDLGSLGKAVARVDNYVTFVSNALPGDVVDIQVEKRRKAYQEGRAVRFHSRSEQRTDPFCIHFGQCGGCRLQDLEYGSQLRYKQKEVADNLERIGKLDIPGVSPILASENQRHYRNKLEFAFSNRRWLSREEVDSGKAFHERNALGFHIPGMFDRVIDLEECHLQPEPSGRIRLAVRDYAREHVLSFFDIRNRRGLLRNLVIRNTLTGEWMVVMVFFTDDKPAIGGLMAYLEARFPEITSLMYCINPKANDSVSDLDFTLYSGKDHIVEHLEGMQIRIGLKSFFQTNPLQAIRMYEKVREFAGLTGSETLYDLYSGAGAIGIFLAGSAAKVIGMEYMDEAVRDAGENARLNRVENIRFFSGDIRNILTPEFIGREGRPDVLVTDPPRAGMHRDVVEAILASGARRIVYVSCNPATQARDLAMMNEKYGITAVQPVDMFPHTWHVENIVRLDRRPIRGS